MTEPLEMPGVGKTESTLLVLFIPSVDRNSQPIDQTAWLESALELLGRVFGGATAYPKGRGVWRDDRQGGKLIFDEPIVIHCYTHMDAVKQHLDGLHEFLKKKGRETHQGAVGLVIADTYYEISFPIVLEEIGREQ